MSQSTFLSLSLGTLGLGLGALFTRIVLMDGQPINTLLLLVLMVAIVALSWVSVMTQRIRSTFTYYAGNVVLDVAGLAAALAAAETWIGWLAAAAWLALLVWESVKARKAWRSVPEENRLNGTLWETQIARV